MCGMHHIDEHSIEQFILGTEMGEERRAAIESHLQECHGCRKLADTYREFYADAARALTEIGNLKEKARDAVANRQKSLVRQEVSLKAREDQESARVVLIPPTRMDRFRFYARQHPVTASAGSFAILAGLALAGTLLVGKLGPHGNPVFKSYNESTGRMELLGRDYKKLWDLPILSARGSRTEEGSGSTSTLMQDLDGDGTNEVITTERLPSDLETQSHPLRVYDAKGAQRFSRQFTDSVDYVGGNYSSSWRPFHLLIDDYSGTGKPDIIVNVPHLARSPNFIARLDFRGAIIGEYWHFGRIQCIHEFDLNGDGRKEIIAVGTNDTRDTVDNGSFAFLSVLDPAKIAGNSRSSSDPGFRHMSPSDAEIYYIKFPSTDLNKILHISALATQAQIHADSTFTTTVTTLLYDSTLGSSFLFYYDFSKDMRVNGVRPLTTTQQLYARLAGQGLVSGTMDAAYLANLRDGVRYWDGENWQKDAVRVRRAGSPAQNPL